MLTGTNTLISTGSDISINNAQIILADVEAENGVVHVIDAVLNELTTDIPSINDVSINVFPNPATSYIEIDIYDQEIKEVKIFNAQMQLVNHSNIESNSTNINLQNLMQGNYLMQFLTDDKIVKMHKLIIE